MTTPRTTDALQPSLRWVHLPVEVKVREFQSRLFLACSAAERGYGAVIGAKSKLADLAVDLPTGIYVEKSSQRPIEGHQARRAMGHLVCCLDEEGFVCIDADEYAASRLDHDSQDLLERTFTWGDDQADVVARFHPPTADRIRVTGNPRVDLWRPELRTIYQDEADALTAQHGGFVLVPTALAVVNNSRGPDFFLHRVAENGMLDTPEKAQLVHGYIEHSRAIFEALCKAVVRLAEAVPDRQVIIRPHPSEDLAPWEEAAAAADNLSVVHEGPVTPWLQAAAAVVHNNCTTGVEAFLMGRPTIAYAPRQDRRYDQNVPNRISRLATDEDELIDMVRASLDGTAPAPTAAALDLLGHHISALDGPFAATRLVDAFDELDVPEEQLVSSPGRRARRKLRMLPLRGRRLGRVAAERVTSRTAEDRSGRVGAAGKFPGSSLAEVVELIHRFSGATGRFTDLDCFEIRPDVYAITPGTATSG